MKVPATIAHPTRSSGGYVTPCALLIRGTLSGALLGVATSLALGATLQTGQSIVGALIFPAGFVIIVLLGLELLTGSFAVLPLGWIDDRVSAAAVLRNWWWVFLAQFAGRCDLCRTPRHRALNDGWRTSAGSARRKTHRRCDGEDARVRTRRTCGPGDGGGHGDVLQLARVLGVVMAMSSTSTIGKIAAAWLPILVFFAQGFEHSVVNMFVIPTGRMLGARSDGVTGGCGTRFL